MFVVRLLCRIYTTVGLRYLRLLPTDAHSQFTGVVWLHYHTHCHLPTLFTDLLVVHTLPFARRGLYTPVATVCCMDGCGPLTLLTTPGSADFDLLITCCLTYPYNPLPRRYPVVPRCLELNYLTCYLTYVRGLTFTPTPLPSALYVGVILRRISFYCPQPGVTA